ncbi:FAD-dependent oxidoreductase [Candidatus Marithrix sp. Canyon 246]|uniref:FAD-dependent oxidoreductase n=1 Tax=Candidatus Marithrix sp. Canyon 246 TaxID=1827136 RepID=UPI000849F7E0|nr:FAD-dependent oxidoreductase [Candidatus Marithrix sp. Canyon 246]
MAHTLIFQKFVRLLRATQVANQQQGRSVRSKQTISRRQLLKMSAVVGAGTLLPACRPFDSTDDQPKIVIVGAGLAGLNAAYQLKKAGYQATLYEASNRVGGRMFTMTDEFAPDTWVDLGGEFVNSSHKDMLSLIKEFNLTLDDRHALGDARPKDYFFFDGQLLSEDTLIKELSPIVERLTVDAKRLDEDWENASVELDQLSMATYLDGLGVDGWPRKLIDQVMITEMGLEMGEMSSLSLLWQIPIVGKDGVKILGDSDERFKIRGGTQQLINALAKEVETQIQTGKPLQAIHSRGDGFNLTFQGLDVEADFVILALPFTILRQLEVGVELPEGLRRFIKEVGYGHNAKVMAGFKHRVWQQQGVSCKGYTEDTFQTSWEGTELQSSEVGVITYFLGGDVGLHSINGTPKEQAEKFIQETEKFIPGISAQSNGQAKRMHWPTKEFVKGSYACFKPGQYTNFIQDYVYIEDEKEGQDVAAGNLIFAGEHLSDEHQGFMNGAAQTGRLAAEHLLRKIKNIS